MTPYWRDEKRDLSIYHGDCAEVMPDFPADHFGSVITDPPYGVGIADWDVPPDQAILDECLRVAEGSVVMFGAAAPRSMEHFWALHPERMLVWAPPMSMAKSASCGMYFHWHPVYIWRPVKQDRFYDDVLRHNTRRAKSAWTHCSMKPPKLIRDLCAAFGGTSVLDPYLGSGTTLAACAKLGLPGVGIEISEEYCHMAASRLSDDVTYGETNLFNRDEG